MSEEETPNNEQDLGQSGIVDRIKHLLQEGKLDKARPQGVRQHIHIIINPVSGRNRSLLRTFNTIFQTMGVEWNVSVTNKAGDARRLTTEVVSQGVDVVAVYGGDGTVREVASALVETDVPLAILPGGTANALALALEIPVDLVKSAVLAVSAQSTLRAVDVAQFDDDYFLVAAGIGIPGMWVEAADRESKDRLGPLAYALRAIQAARDVEVARYSITLDGREVETEGVSCIIANAGNFGLPGLSLSKRIDMADGLLDVFVIQDTNLDSILSLAASVVQQDETTAPFQHWQARQVSVTAHPPQASQIDGEFLEPRPLDITVVPQAVRIIVPPSVDS
jgi:YegS/Rv2252/BmrU family lipid kinase